MSTASTGYPTPRSAMQAASTLAVGGKAPEAVALLVEARPLWASVPPGYEVTLGRVLLSAGRPEEALAQFRAALPRLKKGIPPRVHRLHGRALLASGSAQEAGEAFALALEDGTAGWSVGELVCAEDHALRLGQASPMDRRRIAGFTFVDAQRDAAYLMIPKNACTILKATFVMNSPVRARYLESGHTIHRFYSEISREQTSEPDSGHEARRVVVLRDPLTRLVSAYLNKIVSTPELDADMIRTVDALVGHAQRLSGLAPDRERSITFAEFVRYLSSISDAECNPHWLPQVRLAGTDLSLYAHAGRFERLDATMDFLSTTFGMIPETSVDGHIRAPETHATRYDPDCSLAAPWNAVPETLRACERGYPTAEAFYDPPLREAVLARYAADAALHERL